MKTCLNCQAAFADDSLKYCLECGNVLPMPQETESPQKAGSGSIIAAILGGFAVLAVVIGGLGFYYFSHQAAQENRAAANLPNNSSQSQANERRNSVANRELTLPVDRLDNQKNSSSAATSNNASNRKSSSTSEIVASSSSVRQPDNGNFYFPSFAFDNNPATAWCEGAESAGVGEWLQFNFTGEIMLNQLKIQPGYFKNPEAWRKNNRVARVSVEFSDGSRRIFSLTDKMEIQTFDVGRTRTSYVKITIDDFFAGDADAEDTLISEVSFVTEP